MILEKPINDITPADIQELISNRVGEGMFLEYKEQLPGEAESEKKEFLADVSSFANSGGGVVIYGISEERDANNRATGYPQEVVGLSGLNPDQEILRLQQIARSGVDPKIPSIEMRHVEGFSNGPVLVVRVPRSFAVPHNIIFKNSGRFFARTSAGKHQLDVREISSLVLQASALPERMKTFRQERLAKIMARETPVRIGGDPVHVLHVMPLLAFAGSETIDLTNLESRATELRPPGASSWSQRYNIDGFVTASRISDDGDANISYLQVFRNGVIEFVTAREDWVREGVQYVPSVGYERYTIEDAKQALQFFQAAQLSAPVVIMASILGVKKAVLITRDNEHGDERTHRFGEDHLLLPDVTLKEFANPIETVLRPIFDSLWQAGGFPKSTSYTATGQWQPRWP